MPASALTPKPTFEPSAVPARDYTHFRNIQLNELPEGKFKHSTPIFNQALAQNRGLVVVGAIKMVLTPDTIGIPDDYTEKPMWVALYYLSEYSEHALTKPKKPDSIDDLFKTVIMFDKGIMYAAFAFLGGLYNVMIHYH